MISMRFSYSSMKLPTASRKRCSFWFCIGTAGRQAAASEADDLHAGMMQAAILRIAPPVDSSMVMPVGSSGATHAPVEAVDQV